MLKVVADEALLHSESGRARAGQWTAGFQKDAALLRAGICIAAYPPPYITKPQAQVAPLSNHGAKMH